jgi:glycosyltransferase involved in cell wall biosynthesis
VELPSGSLARRKLFRKAADFDGVFLHKKKLNFVDAFWLRRYSRKIIYNFDDAIMYSDKNPKRYSHSHLIPFRRSVKLADMVIVGNSYLAEHARKFNPNVEILPNGLETSSYKRRTGLENDEKIRLVWIGCSSTLKYLVEIKFALEEIGTRFDNVVLRIIADEFFDLQNIAVEKHPWSEEMQVIDLVTSDIGLAPLPDNRFTKGKCGFKILQYASAGLPVVASPVGVNAEYVCEGVTGFHAMDIRQWVNKISRLVEDPVLRNRMGQAGNVQVQRFDLSVIGKQLCKLVKKCLEGVAP